MLKKNFTDISPIRIGNIGKNRFDLIGGFSISEPILGNWEVTSMPKKLLTGIVLGIAVGLAYDLGKKVAPGFFA